MAIVKRPYSNFRYVEFDNIINLNTNLRALGVNNDVISNRRNIYLFLMKYLGVISKDQLCKLTNLLKRDIHASVKELNKNGFLVNIEPDRYDRGNNYYLATKKADEDLIMYANKESLRNVNVGAKINHFCKINDLYLNLFRDSGCTELTIDYSVDFSGGIFTDKEFSSKNRIIVDGVIDAIYNGNISSLYIELDNGTEVFSTLKKKVESYFNVCLHQDTVFDDSINYFIFRLDKYLYKNHIRFCDDNALKREEYSINLQKCDELVELRKKAKKCTNEEEFSDFIKRNKIDIERFEFSSDTFKGKINRLCMFLSSVKSGFEYRNEELKREERTKYISVSQKGRINELKKAMLEDFNVMPFDFDSKDSIYKDITGKERYSVEYEKMEGIRVLLRTNFICGDTNIDKWFNKLIFNDKDILIDFANEMRDLGKFPDDEERVQRYIKLGSETLCFSNVIDDTENFSINYALMMPSVSVSDFARIQYICNSNEDDFEKHLEDEYLLIFIAVDNDKDLLYYNKLTSKYKSGMKRIAFMVHKIDL